MAVRVSCLLLCQLWLMHGFLASSGARVVHEQAQNLSFDENILWEAILDMNDTGADWATLDRAINFTKKPCDWTVVECQLRNRSGVPEPVQVVTYLRIPFQISSFLPGRLGALTELRTLDASFCNFTGSIPPELFNATNLEFLDFEYNWYLGGSIPTSIGKLQKLTTLRLSYTNVTGTLDTLRQLNASSMVELDLQFANNMTGDLFALRGFTQLQKLYLSGNDFTGTNLSFIEGMTKLSYLQADEYKLRGDLTPLQNLSELTFVQLYGNELTGSLAPLRGLNLTTIMLSYNNLTGDLKPLESMKTLRAVYLRGNQLTGNLRALSNLDQLETLLADENRLSGPLSALVNEGSIVTGAPSSINRKLSSLSLAFNDLTGEIPSGLIFSHDASSPYTLAFVNLSGNNLVGSIPIPPEGAVTFLSTLDLSHNMLDRVDQWLNLSREPDRVYPLKLDVFAMSEIGSRLDFHDNKLSGPIESFPGNVTYVALSNNNISGPLPDPVSDRDHVVHLQTILLNNNSFTGPIPAGFADLEMLDTLDLSYNSLSGALPDSLFQFLVTLETLNLSMNEFSGPVPGTLAALAAGQHLRHLNLSNNRFTGRLPSFPTGGNFTYAFSGGNEGLCSNDTIAFKLPQCPPAPDRRWIWLAMGLLLAALFALLVGAPIFLWRRRVRRNNQLDFQLVSTVRSGEISCHLIPFRDIRKATNNFSASAQIGEGGFGKVYKGMLDGREVAIKRSMYQVQLPEAKTQFMNEVHILSLVNHRNLVTFLGCCLTRKEAILVFEFVPRGTLAEHLHGEMGQALDWYERLNIAVQTAKALSYLHSAANPPIYHRDVKSANILLDERLDAKVADFGISKLIDLDATHVTTLAIQGTPGYIDPEYYKSFQLTEKSDVYSFGVVLLEIITAQAPVDYSRGDRDINLVHMAAHLMRTDALHLFLDPSLKLPFADDRTVRDSILRVANLALRCVERESKGRPTMKEVWTELLAIQQPIARTYSTDNAEPSES